MFVVVVWLYSWLNGTRIFLDPIPSTAINPTITAIQIYLSGIFGCNQQPDNSYYQRYYKYKSQQEHQSSRYNNKRNSVTINNEVKGLNAEILINNVSLTAIPVCYMCGIESVVTLNLSLGLSLCCLLQWLL